jgi:hypothetical protein
MMKVLERVECGQGKFFSIGAKMIHVQTTQCDINTSIVQNMYHATDDGINSMPG